MQDDRREIRSTADAGGEANPEARTAAMAERLATLEARVVQVTKELRRFEARMEDEAPLLRRIRRRFQPKLWRHEQYPARRLDVPGSYASEPGPAMPPSVAVVTPSFNQGRFLRATIESVLAQDYPALRYVVCDGLSRDESVAVLRSFGDRISWVSERDGGQADAINRGFGRVSGDIMAWLNSDDLWLPGTLRAATRYFEDHPDIDLVYGHRIFIDSDGGEIGRCLLPAHDDQALRYADFVPQETLFWRRRVWDAIGPIDTRFRFAMDWDFLLRARAAGFKMARLPRFLGCFRVHDEQKTGAMIDVGHHEMGILRGREFGRTVTNEEVQRGIRRYLARHVLYHRAYKLRLIKL